MKLCCNNTTPCTIAAPVTYLCPLQHDVNGAQLVVVPPASKLLGCHRLPLHLAKRIHVRLHLLLQKHNLLHGKHRTAAADAAATVVSSHFTPPNASACAAPAAAAAEECPTQQTRSSSSSGGSASSCHRLPIHLAKRIHVRLHLLLQKHNLLHGSSNVQRQAQRQQWPAQDCIGQKHRLLRQLQRHHQFVGCTASAV
jgi:hypothetical protein